MAESKLTQEVRLLSHGDVRLFRNNVGVLQDKKGNYVAYGLCVGSSDCIGWVSRLITPDMVGQRIAQFTAIETKAGKKTATAYQADFIAQVIAHGGIAGVVYTIEEARQLLNIDAEGFRFDV